MSYVDLNKEEPVPPFFKKKKTKTSKMSFFGNSRGIAIQGKKTV